MTRPAFGRQDAVGEQGFQRRRRSIDLSRCDLSICESGEIIRIWFDGRLFAHVGEQGLAVAELLREHRPSPNDLRLALRRLRQPRQRARRFLCAAHHLIDHAEALEMLCACQEVAVRCSQAFEIAGSFRELARPEGGLGGRFERFPGGFNFNRLPESRERAHRILGLKRSEAGGQSHTVFVGGLWGLCRKVVQLLRLPKSPQRPRRIASIGVVSPPSGGCKRELRTVPRRAVIISSLLTP